MVDKDLLGSDKSGMNYIVITGLPDNRRIVLRCNQLLFAANHPGVNRIIYQRVGKGWVEVR